MLYIIFGWWLVGFLSCIILSILEDKRLIVGDIVDMMPCSLLGPIVILLFIAYRINQSKTWRKIREIDLLSFWSKK